VAADRGRRGGAGMKVSRPSAFTQALGTNIHTSVTDFASLVARHAARPFDWRFGRADLNRLIERIPA